MGPGYSIDQMLELRRLLSKYVGEEKASEWVKNRFGRHATYGLPAIKQPDGKTKYTAYGTLENIDVRPERYMPPEGATVRFIPKDQWKRNAYGTFNALGGIEMPEQSMGMPYSHPREATLVHEGQHYRDMFSGDEFSNQRGQSLKDAGMLKEMVEPMHKALLGETGITGQTGSDEVLTQLKTYEAQLPAWKRLQGTEFFKNLSNDAKAMIMRRFFPTPKGYDAITGLSYD